MNNEFKELARSRVKRAIKSGYIKRPEICSECSRKIFVEGHHIDYHRPYAVVWLCRACHILAHKENSKFPVVKENRGNWQGMRRARRTPFHTIKRFRGKSALHAHIQRETSVDLEHRNLPQNRWHSS